MSTITLLDGTLKLKVFRDQRDASYEDNICLCFLEDSSEEEMLFRVDETSIFLTPKQAALLVLELNRVLEEYREERQDSRPD